MFRSWRLAAVCLQQIASGLPLGLVWIAIPTWLTQVGVDMSAYTGQTVVLWFNDHDDGYPTDPTYFLLDDVALSG